MGRPKRIRIAIAYDFDGTLAPGNMQERDFIPALGLKPGAFWGEVRELAAKHDMDEILAYLSLMLKKAQEKEEKVSKQAFVQFGKKLKFFSGVTGWFKRINDYGRAAGVAVEHYVISSGLREMISSTSIGNQFKYIFASGFRYDQHDVAIWPALAVNYTNKTQYLFRINKGITNSHDNSTINKYMPRDQRPVPFENMIYIGDGETDVPAMKMVTYQGGRAIAVYPPRKKGAQAAARKLVLNDRAAAAVAADYRDNSDLDKVVKATIDGIAARYRFLAAAQAGH